MAQLVTAVGIAVPSMVGAVVSVIALRRGAKRDKVVEGVTNTLAANTTTLATIQRHVNGMNVLIAKGAHAEGVLEGGDAERANPTGPRT